jgi:hypothetical protein
MGYKIPFSVFIITFIVVMLLGLYMPTLVSDYSWQETQALQPSDGGASEGQLSFEIIPNQNQAENIDIIEENGTS